MADGTLLAAQLRLVSCHEASGRVRLPGGHLDLGLGGALLLDLVLRGRVDLVDEDVVVVDPSPLEDPLLDRALRAISAERRPREPEHWVRHLARGARSAVERRLVETGILRVDDHRVLGVFPLHHTHQTDSRLEDELVERLNSAVVLGQAASRETAALVSLVLGLGLERCLFPRSDLRAVRRRMEEIAVGDWVGHAVRHCINAQDVVLGVDSVADSGAGGAAAP